MSNNRYAHLFWWRFGAWGCARHVDDHGVAGLGDRAGALMPVGRVDLGGRPPRPPTDPGLHITCHPVPHLMNSRPARSVVVTWTWFRSQCTWHVSLQRLMRRHLLPSTGSLGLVPPLQRYYETLRLPDRPFRRASFPSLGDTIVASVVRPPRPRTRSRGSIGSW